MTLSETKSKPMIIAEADSIARPAHKENWFPAAKSNGVETEYFEARNGPQQAPQSCATHPSFTSNAAVPMSLSNASPNILFASPGFARRTVAIASEEERGSI